jgi:nucleoside-diphosphate-sugar epimerase
MSALFITGIGGFIGKRLAERALARGMRVSGLDRDAHAIAAVQGLGVDAHVADICDGARATRLLTGANVVVHTAALVKEYGPLDVFRKINVEGSRSMALAARAAGAQSFVHLSSVMVYGFSYPEGVDENGPLRGENNPYCQTKIESEGAVLALNAPPDFGVIVVRPGDVYGPGSVPWVERPLAMLRKKRLFLPAGGRGVINPVYVDNLIDGIFMALDARAHGEVFNLTDGHAVAYRDYFGKLAERAGLPQPRSLPTALMKGLAFGIQTARKLGLTRDEASVDTVRYLSRRHAYSIAKAERVLGYSPRVGLDEGLARTQAFIDALGDKGETS